MYSDIIGFIAIHILYTVMLSGARLPFRAISPQNGGNVGNAVGIERQKGRAARKRSWRALARLKRTVLIICISLLDKPCFKYRLFKILSRLLLVSLVKSTLPKGESECLPLLGKGDRLRGKRTSLNNIMGF